jgi:hypothetical protein
MSLATALIWAAGAQKFTKLVHAELEVLVPQRHCNMSECKPPLLMGTTQRIAG